MTEKPKDMLSYAREILRNARMAEAMPGPGLDSGTHSNDQLLGIFEWLILRAELLDKYEIEDLIVHNKEGMTPDDIEWIHEKAAMEHHIESQNETIEAMKKDVERMREYRDEVAALQKYKRSYEMLVAELIKQNGGN